MALLAPTLLAALVVVSTFATRPHAGRRRHGRLGIAAAVVAIVLRAPLLVVIAVAAIAAALVRAL